MSIEEDATLVLRCLATYEKVPNDPRRGRHGLDGYELVKVTRLDPDRINDAVSDLDDSGYVEVHRYIGTAPFDFGSIELNARGRRECEQRGPASPPSTSAQTLAGAASTVAIVPVPAAPAPAADLRYVMRGRLGEGAYGEVWRADDTLLKRCVAIKIVRQSGSSNDALAHARALVRVPHPNIVTIFDVTHVLDPVGQTTVPAIVMELVEGIRFDERLRSVVTREDARRIGEALLDAVGAYHAHNLAHMDLHGGNIIVGDTLVKVLDASCTESGYVGSTATREGQHRRDLGSVRDHLRDMLYAGAVSMEEALRFERETMRPTLDMLRRVFVEIVTVVDAPIPPVIAGPVVQPQRELLERAIRAATNPQVIVVDGITEIRGTIRRDAPINGEIRLGQRNDLTFQLRVPITGITGIPLLNIPYGMLRDAWPDAAGRLIVQLNARVMWNGRELQLAHT